MADANAAGLVLPAAKPRLQIHKHSRVAVNLPQSHRKVRRSRNALLKIPVVAVHRVVDDDPENRGKQIKAQKNPLLRMPRVQ